MILDSEQQKKVLLTIIENSSANGLASMRVIVELADAIAKAAIAQPASPPSPTLGHESADS